MGKKIMPTSLTSAQLAEIEQELLRRSTFSARVMQAEILEGLNDILEEISSGEIDRASARLKLSEFVEQSDYTAPEGEEGTIADLTTEPRLNLVLDTNAAQAAGYAKAKIGNDPVLLDAFPCLELFRLGQRKEPRDWPERWEAAGGELFEGRMIARKDDEVWQALGDAEGYGDGLGNPYPPFAFNSGMWTMPVDRKTSLDLGVISKDDEIESQIVEFEPEPGDESIDEMIDDMLGASDRRMAA